MQYSAVVFRLRLKYSTSLDSDVVGGWWVYRAKTIKAPAPLQDEQSRAGALEQSLSISVHQYSVYQYIPLKGYILEFVPALSNGQVEIYERGR